MYDKEMLILLVEDNPGDIRLTKETVTELSADYKLVSVTDGSSAMKFLRREGEFEQAGRPNMILLDLRLPGMDGHDVLDAIKGDEDLKHIPVVILTTSEDRSDIIRCYNARANCYATKPLDVEKLSVILQTFDDFKCVENFWFTLIKSPVHHNNSSYVPLITSDCMPR
ncbi:MAG: response regulator [Phycisphaerae bacterium]|nr:response regulator [Phycisphaerae bacterium]